MDSLPLRPDLLYNQDRNIWKTIQDRKETEKKKEEVCYLGLGFFWWAFKYFFPLKWSVLSCLRT